MKCIWYDGIIHLVRWTIVFLFYCRTIVLLLLLLLSVAARDKNVWWFCKCIAILTSGGLRPPDPPHESYTNTVTLTTSHYNFNLSIGWKLSSITYARPTLCVISRVYERILIILEEIRIRPLNCLHQGTSCQLVKIH